MLSLINNIILKIFRLPSALALRVSPAYNRWYFCTKGIKMGKDNNIMGHVSVIGPGKIHIGERFCMTNGNHINPIAANLQGSFFTDSPNAIIQIGDNVGMSSTRMWIHEKLSVGNNVKIGGNVLIIDTDCHPINYIERRTSNEGTLSAPITIEDDVWIGAHCIVLKGVTIGARSIIGAGSVVAKDIPSDCIAAGNPCKIIKK